MWVYFFLIHTTAHTYSFFSYPSSNMCSASFFSPFFFLPWLQCMILSSFLLPLLWAMLCSFLPSFPFSFFLGIVFGYRHYFYTYATFFFPGLICGHRHQLWLNISAQQCSALAHCIIWSLPYVVFSEPKEKKSWTQCLRNWIHSHMKCVLFKILLHSVPPPTSHVPGTNSTLPDPSRSP